MNETMIFKENDEMYLCQRASYTSYGFQPPQIWKECKKIPSDLIDTQPRGTAVVVRHNDKEYMLYNTAGEACGKWFTLLGEGIRFEKPENIPAGISEGWEFISKRFPDRALKLRRRFIDKTVKVIAKYGNLDEDDFHARQNTVTDGMEYYSEMRGFFAEDLYNRIMFSSVIDAGHPCFKKYNDRNIEVSIDDILSDLRGNWEYAGGIGEIIF